MNVDFLEICAFSSFRNFSGTQLRTECDRLGLTEQSNDRVGDSHKPSAKSQRKSDASFSPTISKKRKKILLKKIVKFKIFRLFINGWRF